MKTPEANLRVPRGQDCARIRAGERFVLLYREACPKRRLSAYAVQPARPRVARKLVRKTAQNLHYSETSSLRNQWRSSIAHGAPLLPLETQWYKSFQFLWQSWKLIPSFFESNSFCYPV